MRETINFVPSKSTPNHKEVQYWIDLQTDPYGRCIKAWTGSEWSTITDNDLIESINVDTWSFIPCGSTDEHGNSTGITSVEVLRIHLVMYGKIV